MCIEKAVFVHNLYVFAHNVVDIYQKKGVFCAKTGYNPW